MNRLPHARFAVWLMITCLVMILTAGCVSGSTPQALATAPLETLVPTPSLAVLHTLAPTKVVGELPNLPTLKATLARPGGKDLPTPFGVPAISLTPGEIDPGLTYFIDQAKDDLAQRLEIEIETITVLEARLVEWPDGSLGCPQPDMAYIQVPVDGALIRLLVGEFVFSYHVGGNMQIFLCENSVPGGPIAPDISK